MKTTTERVKPTHLVNRHRLATKEQAPTTQLDSSETIPALQQLIGNQAVQRLLDPQAESFGLDYDLPAAAGPVQDFNHMRLRPDAGGIYQKKPARSTTAHATAPRTAGPGSMQTHTSIMRYPFRVTIRRGPLSKTHNQPQAVNQRSDAAPNEEQDDGQLKSLFQSLGAAPGGTAAPSGEATEPGATAAPGVEQSTTESTGGGAPAAAAQTPSAPSGPGPEVSGAAPTAGGTTAAPTSGTPTAGGATATPPSGTSEAGGTSGAPVSLPDVELPQLAEAFRTDSIASVFAYTSSITRGGATPSGFGVTRSFGSKLTNLIITPTPGAFIIAGIFEHPITYQIRSGTGPDGQVDISSAADPDITNTNYPAVATDLKPDMSDLNGRPLRTNYWAEDLTTRHELVHAKDDNNNGPAAMMTALGWLNSQTAANEADVNTLLTKVPGRFASALLAALSTEDGEKHAYGDGAPNYKARSELIKEFGDKGFYS